MVNICNDLKELRIKLNENKDITLIIDLSNDNFLSIIEKIKKILDYGIDTTSCISCMKVVDCSTNIKLDSWLFSNCKSVYFINRYENELTDIVVDTGIIARVIKDIILRDSFGNELRIDDLYNLLVIENIFNRQINYDDTFNNYTIRVLNNRIGISKKVNKQL